MDDKLRITTLGNLAITQENIPASGFVSRKSEALLVYIACQPREHLRTSLADFFWADLTQEQAIANLRVVLSNLRRHFPAHVLITRKSVQMNPSSNYWVDIVELRSGLTAIEHLWSSAPLSMDESERLEELLNLYKGVFLAGFHVRDCKNFEDWQFFEQEQIHTQVCNALRHLISYYLNQRHYIAGISIAQRLLNLDPLSEQATYNLMLMLVQNGQRNAALAQYELYRVALQQQLGVEPSDEMKALQVEIHNGKFAVVSETTKPIIQLPMPTTPFVGRQAELAQITAYLARPDCRLLTLVGIGGVGKTRLAIEAASQNLSFRDGIYFVSLLTVSSADIIVPTLASALKISIQGDQSPESFLAMALDNKKMLIILDNVDHLVNEIGILGELLASIQEIKFLVTSRERLNLREEWVLHIKEFEVPSNAADADKAPAVLLFEQVAQRVASDFSLSQNLLTVIEICRLVEGLPLGIELAATWLHLLSCEQILAQLQQDIEILTSATQNVPERHRNIIRLFDYSWDLLTKPEQEMLLRLSIFVNGFSQEAAFAVTGATLTMLANLSQKSFIKRDIFNRYTMHRLLQRYLRGKLLESGQEEEATTRYCEYFIERANYLYKLQKGNPVSADSFDTEFFDLQKVMGWALQYGRSEMARHLIDIVVFCWKERGYLGKYRQ